MMSQITNRKISQGIVTVEDYRKLGYQSRNSIFDQAGFNLQNGTVRPDLFENPDVVVSGINLYSPARSEAILLEIMPDAYFNKMAVAFISGKYLPRRKPRPALAGIS